MVIKDLVFATGNSNKVREAQAILGFPIEMVNLDLKEIQSMNLQEIVKIKAQDAYFQVKRPVIVEDVGFFLERWGGFPGPFIKHVEKFREGNSLTLKMLEGEVNRNVVIKAVIGLHDGDKIHICEGVLKGTVAYEKRGTVGWGFDFIFIPEGQKKTFSEMGPEEKNKISHRHLALTRLKHLLKALAINHI